MELANFNKALNIIEKKVQDQKNWDGAMQDFGVVIRAGKEAYQLLVDVQAQKQAIEAENLRLKAENDSMTHTSKSLPAEIARLKSDRGRLLEEIEAAKRELSSIQTEIESARAYISKGKAAHELLSKLSDQ